MSIKRFLSSSSFRFVGLYVLIYLISALGFILLILSILGTEIEDSIKRDIRQEYASITDTINENNLPRLRTQIDRLIKTSSPLQSIYILKDEKGQIIHSNLSLIHISEPTRPY